MLQTAAHATLLDVLNSTANLALALAVVWLTRSHSVLKDSLSKLWAECLTKNNAPPKGGSEGQQ